MPLEACRYSREESCAVTGFGNSSLLLVGSPSTVHPYLRSKLSSGFFSSSTRPAFWLDDDCASCWQESTAMSAEMTDKRNSRFMPLSLLGGAIIVAVIVICVLRPKRKRIQLRYR